MIYLEWIVQGFFFGTGIFINMTLIKWLDQLGRHVIYKIKTRAIKTKNKR